MILECQIFSLSGHATAGDGYMHDLVLLAEHRVVTVLQYAIARMEGWFEMDMLAASNTLIADAKRSFATLHGCTS